MTPAEIKIWGFLRNRQLMDLKFRRQQPIGRYIVDFVCFEKKLVIELDGGQHLDNEKGDNKRTEELMNYCEKVDRSHPHPTSPIQGEEK